MPGLDKMKVSELQSKLAELFLPTSGIRTELVARYKDALRLQRNKRMSWDASTMSWVPISATF